MIDYVILTKELDFCYLGEDIYGIEYIICDSDIYNISKKRCYTRNKITFLINQKKEIDVLSKIINKMKFRSKILK